MNKENLEIIKDLASLLEIGLISKEEFEEQKKILLMPVTTLNKVFQRFSLILRLFTPQLVILLIICLFYPQISKIITSANEVAFGDSFSFKVQQALRIGDPQLANVVKTLTKEEIITLIAVDNGMSLYSISTDTGEISLDVRYEHYISLQDKGLFYAPIDLSEIKEIIESKEISREETSFDFILNSSRIYYFENQFSEQELSLFKQTSGYLTSDGQRVYWLILDTAAEDLSSVN